MACRGASTQPRSAGARQHVAWERVGFSGGRFPSQTLPPALPRARWAGGHVRAHPGFVSQGSRYSPEHLKHLPPPPSARLGAESPPRETAAVQRARRWAPLAPGLQVWGRPSTACEHRRSEGLRPSGGTAQQAGHPQPCPPCHTPAAACRPLGTGRSCRWQQGGESRAGGGALISSFKANISLPGLCKPLIPTG